MGLGINSAATTIHSVMSSTLTATLPHPLSRPKIHRPPVAVTRTQQKKSLAGLLLAGSALVAAFISISLKKEPVIKEATLLPPVAVVSERIPPATLIGEAQAYQPSGKPGTTITLKDRSGTIVGQMARIPFENDQITEIKAINEVDNSGGRELLSIIGKY